ncbi:hypothetical protein BH23GEM9_BH23GEM9_05170 [soil metagenome]
MNRVFVRRAAALFLSAAAFSLGACAAAPQQRVVEIAIHDDGGKLRFEPEHVEVRRGDVVRWTMGNTTLPHNVEFVRNGAPEGAELGESWSGPYMSEPGETYEVVIDDTFRDGSYGYVCAPHVSMGMAAGLTVNGGASSPRTVATAAAATVPAAANRPVITGVQGFPASPWTRSRQASRSPTSSSPNPTARACTTATSMR